MLPVRTEPGGAFLDNESRNLVGFILCPDDKDIGDRRVGDPGFTAVQAEAPGDGARAGLHAPGVGAVIRFGEAEAAD